MSTSPTESHRCGATHSIPADHILNSGAVTFPGSFDQQGCPLVVFPVEGQSKLASDLTKEDVVGFISYFLQLHNKLQEKESLISVVVDLRKATLTITRFIAETLLLLELHKRTVHTLYAVQPKKKEVLKMLLKVLIPSHTRNGHSVPFKCVFLKEVYELCSYIDRSQLMAELGGYLVYCHQSWVAFLKEIDEFVQEFLSVVHRLPSCIATLHGLSRQVVPSALEELEDFCSVNEAKFQELRRELGLDELLRHCERVLEKLRYPENDPCYQDMAGTALFTHTTYDMLQNYNRITAAVEKMELLWQQASSKARLRLQVLRLQNEAQQVNELINKMQQEKLQPYRIEMAKDAKKAESLKLQFEVSIYTPAMALVRRADDVIHTLAETVPPGEVRAQAEWVGELEHVKQRFCAAVQLPQQTLQAVSDFYLYYNKSKTWYEAVLCENHLQDLLWSGSCDRVPKLHYAQDVRTRGMSPWKQESSNFLRRNPSPELEELVQLAHLANVIPDPQMQQNGKQLSHRCTVLRKLLTSNSAVPLNDLQLALQWQYEFLRTNKKNPVYLETGRAEANKEMNTPKSSHCAEKPLRSSMLDVHSRQSNLRCGLFPGGNEQDAQKIKGLHHKTLAEMSPGMCHVSAKPPSLSSYDSGFDGAGSTRFDSGPGRDGLSSREVFKPKTKQPQINEEKFSSVSDSEECKEIDVGGSSNTRIQISPKVTVDSLNFKIKVKRSAVLPRNPWLSLPVEDLEKSYTVTIMPNVQRDLLKNPPVSEQSYQAQSSKSQDASVEMEMHASSPISSSGEDHVSSIIVGGAQTRPSVLEAQDTFGDSELSPIRNVFSSTITDTQENSNASMESHPTLLWDTYDFHITKPDGSERLSNFVAEISLSDWDIKEQEGLQQVEEILDRTAEILEEEENVLAQEEMLNVLLKSDPNKHWSLWEYDNQISLSGMSSKELMEAGVDFEDGPCQDRCDQLAESHPWGFALTPRNDKNDYMLQINELDKSHNTSRKQDLLQELRDLSVLDQRIMEENLKIHELRQSEETANLSVKQSNQRDMGDSSKDRQMFLKKLEKEKREVEEMETSLKRETAKSQLKKKLHRGRKVVKCSIMERNSKLKQSKDTDLCNQVVSSSIKQVPEEHLKSSCENFDITTEFSDINAKSIINHNSASESPVSHDQLYGEGAVNCQIGKNASTCHGISHNTVCLSDSLNKAASVCNLLEKDEGMEQGESSCMADARKEDGECVEAGVAYIKSQSPGREDEDVGGLVRSDLEVCLTAAAFFENQEFECGGDINKINKPPVAKPRKMCRSEISQAILKEAPVDKDVAQLTKEFSCPPMPKKRTKQFGEIHLAKVSADVTFGDTNNNNNKELEVTSQHLTSHITAESDCFQVDGLRTVVSEKCYSDSVEPETHSVCTSLKYVEKDLKSDLSCTEGALTCISQEVVVAADIQLSAAAQSNILQDGSSVRSIDGPPFNISHQYLNMQEFSGFGVPIILDTGSGLTKAGFADQDLPTTIFPTVIGFPKYEEVMNGASKQETYTGHEAQHMRGVLTLKYPMKNGIIQNWDDMEKIWHHAFQQLCADPKDHPVLLTEAAMNSRENRQRMVELMFEAFGVPYTYVAMQAVLALYSAGRTTGMVFDSGDGVSHSVPVFEGYCLPHAVQRFPLAGADVTLHLRKLLLEQGVVMHTSAELEIVREMKEQCCYVAQDNEGSVSSSTCYTMPDGLVVHLSTERFRAPEILFKPELIGRDHYGIHESIFKSILQCDIDLRKSFVGNILLSGGNTMLAGLPQRLQNEIRDMAPLDLGEYVRVTSPKDRDFSVWSGGAVLASLPSFTAAWISQEEYEEFGPQIVFRKCF